MLGANFSERRAQLLLIYSRFFERNFSRRTEQTIVIIVADYFVAQIVGVKKRGCA